jgi:hypothetical protein
VKSPLIIFALKCSVILYFAACTGINEYTSSVSATPQITKGAWKVNLFTEEQNDQTSSLADYTLTFEPTGKIIAIKNGEKITGNWAEDDILKRITINLDTKDAALLRLNDYWNITKITKAGLSFKSTEKSSNDMLQITSL